ncbi:MAG TPA: lycopene cyclase domain-containing protein [Micropruina sp.]|jgi:lycopene beta-cyclase|nr:lycopene cyclase domain-containing protein [Micropruina sp.]
MHQFQYLLLMAGCLLITLPLELVLEARVYARWRLMLLALLPTVLVFVVWDLVGIIRLHWTYNPEYISGVHLWVMPLEELVFFIVIPICGLLTYEAVGTVLRRLRERREHG